MARIYTKTGDAGKTSLFGGTRLSKDHIRIEAYGTIDELNSFVGFLREQVDLPDMDTTLKHIQERLFSIGASLASDPDKNPLAPDIRESDVKELEEAIDAMQEVLPKLRRFVLPGGNIPASVAHLCRTVCRRAERRIVTLAEESEVQDEILSYINRMSDYFFVISRFIVHEKKDEEITWEARPEQN